MGLTVFPEVPTCRDLSSHLASTIGREHDERGAHRLAELLHERDVLLVADAPADGDEHVFAGDVDVSGFRLDQFHELPAGGESRGVR